MWNTLTVLQDSHRPRHGTGSPANMERQVRTAAARKRMGSGDPPGLQMWRIPCPARVFNGLGLPRNPTIGAIRGCSGRIMQWIMQ